LINLKSSEPLLSGLLQEAEIPSEEFINNAKENKAEWQLRTEYEGPEKKLKPRSELAPDHSMKILTMNQKLVFGVEEFLVWSGY